MNKIFSILVISILVISLGIRIWGSDKSPAFVNQDEASIGINAKCLGENLRDEYGNWLPINLRSLNDYKPALYSYLSIPIVKTLGLNQTSIRLLSSVAGVIGLWGIYLLSGLFVKNKWVRLLGLVIIGMGPLRLHYSRVAVETNLSAMFMIWGLYFIFKDKLKSAFVVFVMAILSYHSARIMVPIFLLLLATDPIKFKLNFRFVKYFVVMGLLVFGLSVLAAGSLNRFGSESIMRLWPFVPREVGSWLYYAGFYISGHVFSMMNPMNMVENNYEWFKNSVSMVANSGLVSMTMAVLIVVGFFNIPKKLDKNYRILGYWFVAAVVPVVMTWNWFYPLRSLNALLVLEIIALLGLQYLVKNKIAIGMLGIFFIWEMVFTVNNEFNYTNFKNYLGYEHSGINEISKIIKDKSDYKIIVDTNQENAYLFYQFYGNTDCKTIQAIKDTKALGFGNIEFRKIDWEKDIGLTKTILVSEEVNNDYKGKEKGARVIMVDSPLTLYQVAMVMIFD